MNTKLLSILVATMVLAGCRSTQPEPTTTATPSPESAAVQELETASLQMADAFVSGKPLQCQVTPSSAGEPASTFYFKNSKMRMESQPTTENDAQYIALNDGTTIYMWSTDPAVPGMKLALDAVKKSDENFDNQLQNFPDLRDEAEREKIEESGSSITCSEAEIDDSLLLPPADVTFRDFSEMMGSNIENIPELPQE